METKLSKMFKAIEEMPEELQRFCVKVLIGEYDSRVMEKKLLVPTLKMICFFKPNHMNAIARGMLK